MKTAVIQMNSTGDRGGNLGQAGELLAQAAGLGAGLAVLPEHFSFMQAEGSAFAVREPLRGPTVAWLAEKARSLGMWVVGGSFAQRASQGKVFNTCPVLDNYGELRAWYQKIHLFELALPLNPELTESAHTRPGRRLAVVDSPIGRMGLSICYDLRFPELYRRLRLKGAQVLTAPSAFTKVTGQAHWELLVRARAVENCCFVLAAAQDGVHAPGRESFGNAMIVDPWGEVLARCGPGPGVALAEVGADAAARARRRMDSTDNARLLPAAWGKRG